MDKTACTQINEGQGYSKGLRIKLLYRVCSRSARAGFSEQYAKQLYRVWCLKIIMRFSNCFQIPDIQISVLKDPFRHIAVVQDLFFDFYPTQNAP